MTAVSDGSTAEAATYSSKRRPVPQTLSRNVRSGAIWNMASTIILRVSSIGVTALTARILNAHDFGVFAIATIVFTIVTAIGEFGVTSCLSRADLDVDSLAPTLWTVSLATSLLMAGALIVFAVPLGSALGSADAAGAIRVMALTMVPWGLAAVPTAQCIREFKQDKIFLANVLSFIPSTVVLLLLAEHGSGALAFAWSRVVAQAVSCAVILFSAPKLYLPGLQRAALWILFTVGVPLAIANFANNILQNVDYALIGRFVGSVPLGTYVIAFNSASWSSTLLGGVLGMVAMPAFSRVKHDEAQLMVAIRDGVRAVTLIAAPMCTLVAVLSHPFILTVYGGRWTAAAHVLAILSIYGLIAIAGTLFSSMLAALGRSKSVLIIQLAWLVLLIPAMALGVRKDGITGAAIAHVIVIGPIILPCYIFALKRSVNVKLVTLVRAALPPLTAAAISAALAWFASKQFDVPSLSLIAGLAVGGLSYFLLTAPQLIPLLGSSLARHPAAKKVLRIYNIIGRTVGIQIGPPPRHARRRRLSRSDQLDAAYRVMYAPRSASGSADSASVS